MVNKKIMACTAALFALLGCAKDQTQQQYTEQQTREFLARYQAIEGRYRGVVNSPETGAPLGALELYVRADLAAPTTTNSGTPVTGAPTMVCMLTFRTSRNMEITSRSTSYETDSGILHADFQIDPQAASSDPSSISTPGGTVSMTANVSNGVASGTVRVLDGEEVPFSLKLNSASLESLAHTSATDAATPPEDQLSAFAGTAMFSGGDQKPLRIVLLRPTTTPEQEFLNMLSPTKYLQVSLNFSAAAHLAVNNAIWDQDSGSLNGTTTMQVVNISSTQNVAITVQCSMTPGSRISSMDCKMFTAASSNKAQVHAVLETVPGQDPPDNSSSGSVVYLAYTGTTPGFGGEFSLCVPFAQQNMCGTRTILQVTYPARSRMQDIVNLFIPSVELNYAVSVIYDQGPKFPITHKPVDAGTTVNIGNMVGDVLSGKLDSLGVSSSDSGTIIGLTKQMHCTGFYGEKTHSAFSCTYSSNYSSSWISYFLPN